MNRTRISDLDLPVETAPPPLDSGVPNDDELDALCDQLMHLDDKEPLDPASARAA